MDIRKVKKLIEMLEESNLEEITIQKKGAIKKQKFEIAAELRDSEKKLTAQLEHAKDIWEKELKAHKETKDLPEMSSLPEPKGLMATPKDSHTKAKTSFKEPEAYKGKLPTRKKVVPVDVSYAPLVEQFTDKLADIEQRRNIGREKLLDRLE